MDTCFGNNDDDDDWRAWSCNVFGNLALGLFVRVEYFLEYLLARFVSSLLLTSYIARIYNKNKFGTANEEFVSPRWYIILEKQNY